MALAPAMCGFEVVTTDDAQVALDRIRNDSPTLTVVDLDLDTTDPLEFLERVRASEAVDILLVAGDRSMGVLRTAVERGACSYLRKPANEDEWLVVFARAQRDAENRTLPVVFLGFSADVQSAVVLAEQAAGLDGHVTLVGERGVGRRSLARLIHQRGQRQGGALAHFSCVGVSPQMVEQTLFGQMSGVAGSSHVGLIEKSHGGTLIIEEVTRLPMRTQETLLKALKIRKLWRGGQGASIPLELRVVALSGTAPNEAVARGEFLRELCDELSSFHAVIPPLRERKLDIPVLADHFVRRAARLALKPVKGVSDAALHRLMRYDWPGNVSELEHMVAKAVETTSHLWLTAEDLPALPDAAGSPASGAPGATIQEIEREAIMRTLEAVDGSTSRAAQVLNMSVRKIQYKLKEYRKEAAAPLHSEKVETVSPAPARSRAARSAGDAVFVAKPDAKD
jgi:two-component system NtrC family response regulator